MEAAYAAALAVLRESAVTLLQPRTNTGPLRSIFSQIAAHDNPLPQPSFYAARSLQVERATLFPTPNAGNAKINADVDLASRFAAAYAELPHETGPALEQLYYKLQEYAWSVPSQHDDSVSLFDQARTDAAIAAAEAGQQTADGVLILGGDISGVQSFLYTLTAAGATRALRARSFYLQLLTDALAGYLLNHAGMPVVNLLYSGGGRFYVVLPQSAVHEIDRWRQELGQFMLRRHSGELYVALGDALFDRSTLADGDAFQARWRVLNEAINSDKRRRFAALGATTLAQELFTPQGRGGGPEAACIVCRFQGELDRELVPFVRDDDVTLATDEETRICKLCESFIKFASDLHNAQYLILTRNVARLPDRRERVPATRVLADLGLTVGFVDKSQELIRSVNATRGDTLVLSLRDPVPDDTRRRLRELGIVYGIRLTANETPTMREHDRESLQDWAKENSTEHLPKVGAVKTFGILVEQSVGVKRLGVLRMDIDDLGDLFASSLRDASLARVGALSAALARFFEGWVDEVCQELNADAQRGAQVYLVYSGGDDLFIVGSWEVLPGLARRIREDLRAYVQNQAIHLSGGLSLHAAKFPLYQAAEAAHEELQSAKDRPGKDAFGFLGQVIGWGASADDVFELQSQLVSYIQSGQLSRSILQVVQGVYSQYLQALTDNRRRRPGTFFFGPWVWRAAYQMARIADERRRQEPEATRFVETLGKRLTEGAEEPPGIGLRFVERAGLAARWAQLLLRKE